MRVIVEEEGRIILQYVLLLGASSLVCALNHMPLKIRRRDIYPYDDDANLYF